MLSGPRRRSRRIPIREAALLTIFNRDGVGRSSVRKDAVHDQPAAKQQSQQLGTWDVRFEDTARRSLVSAIGASLPLAIFDADGRCPPYSVDHRWLSRAWKKNSSAAAIVSLWVITAKAYPTILPMSWVTGSPRFILRMAGDILALCPFVVPTFGAGGESRPA